MSAKIPLFDGKYSLPYCGHITPFPSDYEVPPWSFLLQPIRRLFPGAFIDVGVNIGQTLLLVKELDPQWDYIGFEPNPVSFLIAQQVAQRNKFDSCRLIPVGLSDKERVVEMESNSETDASATVISGFRRPGLMKHHSFVAVMPGDATFESIGCTQVGIVKIDVEGGELEVLRGLQECLRTNRPLVFCEVIRLRDSKSVGDFRVERQRAVEQLLRELDFSIFRIEPPKTVRFLPQVPDDSGKGLEDYLFVPNERRSELESAMNSHGIRAI